MKRLRNIVLLVALCLCFSSLRSYSQMRVNFPDIFDAGDEYFQIQFTVDDTDVHDFVAPPFDNFNVLAGPFSSVRSSMSIVNGKTSRQASTTFTYTVSPKKTGTFTIGSASAWVAGKRVTSAAKTIKIIGVLSSASNQSKNETKSEHTDSRTAKAVSQSSMSIQVIPSRKKIYTQEPVLLTYKFYAKPTLSLSQIGMHKKPDFKGMISQEFPMRNIQMGNEEINGEIYRSGIIQRYVIFPQNAGKIKVPGLIFDCEIFERNEMIDPFDAFFNGGGSIARTIQRKVDDITLNVLPLPTPQPADFSGGVGSFTIKGELLTSDLRTNDVVSYRITISGKGNLNLLSAPKIELNDDFDSFAPKVTDDTQITEDGLQGRIIYDYTFVPRRVGDYKLPSVIFSYFDPQTESYKTIQTTGEKLHVLKGNKSNEEYEKSQNIINGDIRDLHNSEVGIRPYSEIFWWGSGMYWLIYVFVAFLAIVIQVLLKKFVKFNSDVVSKKSRKAGKMAVRRLKTAKQFMEKNNRDDFYTEVSRALYGYIANKYNLGTADLNRSHIEECLMSLKIDGLLVGDFIRILDECDFAQYAPSNQVVPMNELYQKAIDCIVNIENQK